MLSLYITGYGARKKLCTSAVEWFINKYLPKHHITLEILHRGLKRESVIGWCDISGKTYRPREFLIELDVHMNKELYLKVLFHELTHLLQWVKGELKIKASKRYYKGECMEDLDYNQQPHEIHAFYMEKVLYKEYLKYKNNNK